MATAEPAKGSGQPRTDMQVVPLRHPGRWVAAAVVCLLAVMAVHSLFFSNVKRGGVTEERFEWNIINHYFFSAGVLEGLGITLALDGRCDGRGHPAGCAPVHHAAIAQPDRDREFVGVHLVFPGYACVGPASVLV